MQTGRGRIENKKPVKQTHDEQETIGEPTGGGLEEAQMNYTCAGEGNGTEKNKKLEGGKDSRDAEQVWRGKASWWRKQSTRKTAKDNTRPENKYKKETHTMSTK